MADQAAQVGAMTALWHQNDADVGIGLPRPAPATRSSSREHAPLTHGRSHCVVSACPAIRRRYLLPAAACRNTTGQGFVTIQASWAQRIRHSRLRNSRRNIRCPGDEHRETKAPPPPYAARAPPAAAREETLRGGAGSSGYGGTARGDFFSSSLWLALFTLLIVCCGPLYICFSSLHPAA